MKNNFLRTFLSAFELNTIALNAAAALIIWYISEPGIRSLTDTNTLSPDLLYAIIPQGAMPAAIVIAFIQTFATAALMFVFTSSQRASTAYFSLPISRAKLYWSRYLAGLVMVLGPHAALLAVRLVRNVNVFGATGAVLHGFAIYWACSFVTLSFVYGAAMVVCLCVGTIREKLVFSCITVFGAYYLLGALTIVFSLFLHGNAMGESYAGHKLSGDLFGAVLRYVPPYGAAYVFERYGAAYGGAAAGGGSGVALSGAAVGGAALSGGAAANGATGGLYVPLWGDAHSAGWLVLALWLALSAAAALSARRAFMSYKAEHAGMQGVRPWLTNTLTVIASFALLYEGDGPGNAFRPKITVILLSLVWLFTTYAISRALMTKSIRKIFNLDGLRIYGAVAGVYALAAACGLAGGFGYSSYVPDVGEITSAKITYTGAPDFIAGSGNYYPVPVDPQAKPMPASESYICIRDHTDLEFISDSGINAVQALHKKLIDAGPGPFTAPRPATGDKDRDWLRLWVHVQYSLKNGKTVDRLYQTVPTRLAEDMLLLDVTDEVAGRIGETLSLAAEFAEQGALPLFVTDGLFGNGHAVIAAGDQIRLLSALQSDTENLPLEEKYFPDSPALAVVSLPRFAKAADGGAPGLPVYAYEHEPSRAGGIAVQTGADASPALINNWIVANNDANWYWQHTSVIRIYVTNYYTNTIGFLRESGICGFIDGYSGSGNNAHDSGGGEIAYASDGGEITVGSGGNNIYDTVDIQRISALRYNVFPRSISQSLYFRSAQTNELLMSAAAITIQPDQYGDIMQRARTHYYVSGGGYLIWVILKDESGEAPARTVTLFLPQADAPLYLF
ncbi:MAG: hypothetical protein FWH01_15255 [Oscillospiraceae bacterium]|nr:hypothetical protein [Oscillospiraceae bacterium]